MRLPSFPLCFLFKPKICTYTSKKDQSYAEGLSSRPSDIIDIDTISIPNDFMSLKDKGIISELLEPSIQEQEHESNNLRMDLNSTFEKMSLKYLITQIKNFAFKHFNSQEGKCSVPFLRYRSLIDKMYNLISENDLSSANRTVPYVKIKILLFKILKHLIYCEKSGIFKDMSDWSEQTKNNRLDKLNGSTKEFAYSYANLLKFLEEYAKIKNNISAIENVSLNKITTKVHPDHTKKIPHKPNKSLENPKPLNLPKSSKICSSDSISAKHLFTCKFPFKINYCVVRSFCKSNAGIWYFTIGLYNRARFKILKIDQNDFDLNNSRFKIIENYTIGSDKNYKKGRFDFHCRKIVVNSAKTLYVLQYNEAYSSFEILALDSNFKLIENLQPSSFKSFGLEEIFIEDIAIYSDTLYMYDSENKCIIVTDFDLKLKHIIKFEIEFKKFQDNHLINLKARLNLFVTEKYFYIFTDGEIHACKNNLIDGDNTNVNTIGEVTRINIIDSSGSTSFEKTVYVGNESFISTPIDSVNNLVFTKLVLASVPLTCESKVIGIDHKLCAKSVSLEIATIEDHTVYLVEGGENIKLFKFDKKSDN